MKKKIGGKFSILLFVTLLSCLALLLPTNSSAETGPIKIDGCESDGQCVNGKLYEFTSYPPPYGMICARRVSCGGGEGVAVLGAVKPPNSILKLNLFALIASSDNSGMGIGLILFLSRVLQFGSIIAGLWVMFNVISAAFIYITKPDSDDGLTAVKEKLTMSAVGLSLIVGAFAIAGIIGLIFFGNAAYILNPQLITALDSAVVAP